MTPDPGVSLATVFFLGVSLGLTACAVTCLPFIGTWAFGRAGGERERMRDTALFLGGRLCAYLGLGALAAALGGWFVRELAGGVGNLAIGLAGLHAAAWLAWPRRAHAGCTPARRLSGLSPLLMGASLTLIPCAPLATLLASAAAAGSVGEGALLGGVFGAGTVLTPMLLLIPAASSIGARMVQEQRWLADWLRLGAALVLAIIAAVRIGYFDPSLALPLTLAAALVVLLGHVRLRGTAASPGATGQPVTLHFPRHR